MDEIISAFEVSAFEFPGYQNKKINTEKENLNEVKDYFIKNNISIKEKQYYQYLQDIISKYAAVQAAIDTKDVFGIHLASLKDYVLTEAHCKKLFSLLEERKPEFLFQAEFDWKAILDYTIPRLKLARCIREKVDLLKTHQEILKALEQTDKKCDNKKMIERINYEKRVSFYSFGLCLVSRFSL